MKHLVAVWLAVCVTLSVGCQHEAPHADDEATGDAPAIASVQLQFNAGPTLDLERRTDRWKIASGGSAWGTLKIESDRVKLKQGEREIAKAKSKDYGFKVYVDDRERFKVKRRDTGYSVQRQDGSELGRVQAGQGSLGGEMLRLSDAPQGKVLTRGDKQLLVSKGALPSPAVLMFGVTEASLPERLVMFAMLYELEAH